MTDLTCIIPGPKKVMDERSIGTKWCFGCREYLEHIQRVLGDEMVDQEVSWYPPVAVIHCTQCHRDCTDFPGRQR